MSTSTFSRFRRSQSPLGGLVTVVGAALAGGLGWGIRGQFGHETGAMMAGLLVSLVLVMRLGSELTPWSAIRAVAMGTVAMGYGGSETYGQTLGLTHDPELLGNSAALRWGLLGLAIKGGIWIGFFGLFLGMGLGGVRYRGREILALLVSLPLLQWAGVQLLNEPFDPANKVLPEVYFSDSWKWEPDAELKPRREIWGGLLLALVVSTLWAGWWRKDVLARRLAGWGMFGGALGFPVGQCFQAYHAWHPARFHGGIWDQLGPCMNWWNWMETAFGCILGAVLAYGLIRNRLRIHRTKYVPAECLPAAIGWILLAVHVVLLVLEEFGSNRFFNALYDPGFHLGLIPMLLAAAGHRMAAVVAFVVTALPIAGKTLQRLAVEEQVLPLPMAIVCYALLPLLWTGGLVWMWNAGLESDGKTRGLAAMSLGATALLYFGLNSAFFRFPWPWLPWTTRTPNFLFYTFAVGALLLLVNRSLSRGGFSSTTNSRNPGG